MPLSGGKSLGVRNEGRSKNGDGYRRTPSLVSYASTK